MDIFLEDFSFGVFFWQLFMFALLLGWIYCLYEVVTSEFPGMEGMLWALLVFFAPGIGAIIYLIYGRQRKLKT